MYYFFKFVDIKVGVANFFLVSRYVLMRKLHFSKKFYTSVWQFVGFRVCCARSSGICMPSPNSIALKVSEISAFIRTDGQTLLFYE